MLGVTVEAPDIDDSGRVFEPLGVKVEAAELDDGADKEPLVDGDTVGLDDKVVNVVKFEV